MENSVLGTKLELTTRKVDSSFKLHIAHQAQNPAIDSLRQHAYRNAGYFSLPDPSTVLRQRDPKESICLVISRETVVVATVRLTLGRTRRDSESILEGEAALGPEYFPSLALCRGATHPEYRGQGLMAFLVSMGVASAQAAKLSSTLGLQAEGTHHFPAMQAAGWSSRVVVSDQMKTVRLNTKMNLVFLHRTGFAQSVSRSRDRHSQLHQLLNPQNLIEQVGAHFTKLYNSN